MGWSLVPIYKRISCAASIVSLQERLSSTDEHEPNPPPHPNALGSDAGRGKLNPNPVPLGPQQESFRGSSLLKLKLELSYSS